MINNRQCANQKDIMYQDVQRKLTMNDAYCTSVEVEVTNYKSDRMLQSAETQISEDHKTWK